MTKSIINSLRKTYQGKKILVVGLGLQGGGVGIARFFAELGAKVTVTDKKTDRQLSYSINKLKDLPIRFHLGGHKLSDFLETDLIFKGPSVLWSMREIVEAQKKGIPVEMELSFFTAYFPGKIIGITGTRGKSTTTQMIFNLLKLSGYQVFLGGGFPGISTINYLKTLTKDNWVVMEISSWALSGFHRKKISPHIAVFTNIYPDHLNYYNTIDEYLYDKEAIFLYQKKDDYFIANKSLKKILFHLTKDKKNIIWFDKKDFSYNLKYLKGDHNLENASACLEVAKILKIDEKKAVDILSNFKGLPYRQEIIKEKNNIIFVNDTTSTTPIATIKAIESFKNKKIILILGGNSKNLPFDTLIKYLVKVKKIILLDGSFTDQLLEAIKNVDYHNKIYTNILNNQRVLKLKEKLSEKVYDSLEKAVNKAYQSALDLKKKDKDKIVILFSPGATSFAMFNNEFHRGEEFNRIVKKI